MAKKKTRKKKATSRKSVPSRELNSKPAVVPNMPKSELERMLNGDLTPSEKAELNTFMGGLSTDDRADMLERAGVDVVFSGVASKWEQSLGKSQPQDFTTYMEHNLGWVFACTRVIAFAISGAELKFYKQVDGTTNPTWKELQADHPRVPLCARPTK